MTMRRNISAALSASLAGALAFSVFALVSGFAGGNLEPLPQQHRADQFTPTREALK